MKRTLTLLLGLLLIVAMGSCKGGSTKPTSSGGKGPEWYNNPPKDSTYYYFAGFAEAMTEDNAKKSAIADAKAQLSAYIFEETAVQEVISTYGSLSDNEKLQEDYSRAFESKSKSRMMAVDVEKTKFQPYDDGGMTITRSWILIKISKSVAEKERKRILDEMKRQLELVDKELRKAEAQIKAGKVIDAVQSYISAALASTKVEERQQEFLIYINKANKILANLLIEQDEVPAKVDKDFKSEVSFKLSYSGDTDIAVKGAKLKFTIRNNKGDYSRASSTDKDGIAVMKISRLNQVNNSTQIYAKLGLELGDLKDLEGDYARYYSTLRSTMDKLTATATIKVVSDANRKITSSVIAVKDVNGKYSKIPQLTSEMQSYLLGKGYKVVRFPSGISLKGVVEMKGSVLKQLAAKGIKRVYVLSVDASAVPKYNSTVEKYRAMYAVAAQLIDTKTGELISSKSVRIGGNADSKGAVFSSFVNSAAKKLKRTIDLM